MIKTTENIFFEVYKNFKLIFRNWTALILIILAPLALILLVGYSFSGEQIHDINIGMIIEGDVNLDEFSRNVSSFGRIIEYDFVEDCLADIALQRTHICLEVEGSLTHKPGEIPTGHINIYYDNTRKQISIVLLSQVKDFFGLTSEKISLLSAEELFNNLQELFVFLSGRIDDVERAKNESVSVQQDLIERRGQLVRIRDEFTPYYERVKNAQQQIHGYSDSFENATNEFSYSFLELRNITNSIKNLPDENLGNNTQIQLLQILAVQMEEDIEEFLNITNETGIVLDNLTGYIDSIVFQLDQINTSLNKEIETTEQYIVLINESIMEIDMILEEARQKLELFSNIDPALSSKIVKPITQSFTAVIKELKDIQLAFPMVLLTVAIFISVIFSNILTSIEINNKAYTRNILAPVNDAIFVAGMAITNFLIVLFQIVVLLIVAQTRFGVDVASKLGGLVPIIIVLVFTFVFVGMIVSYLIKNPQTSILLSTFVALAFFLFSDALNALEAMPVFAAKVAGLNPIVIVSAMLRQMIFFNISLSQMAENFIILSCYAGMAFLLLVLFSKIKNRQRF